MQRARFGLACVLDRQQEHKPPLGPGEVLEGRCTEGACLLRVAVGLDGHLREPEPAAGLQGAGHHVYPVGRSADRSVALDDLVDPANLVRDRCLVRARNGGQVSIPRPGAKDRLPLSGKVGDKSACSIALIRDRNPLRQVSFARWHTRTHDLRRIALLAEPSGSFDNKVLRVTGGRIWPSSAPGADGRIEPSERLFLSLSYRSGNPLMARKRSQLHRPLDLRIGSG